MLNVCWDLSAAVQQSAGISRYERQLATALLELGGPVRYGAFFVSLDAQAGFAPGTPLAELPCVSRVSGNKQWRFKLLAAQVAGRKRYDAEVFPLPLRQPRLFHGMDAVAPPLSAATVITVHDLSFLSHPQTHSPYNRLYLRYMLPLVAQRAGRILTVSDNTRRDLLNWLGPQLDERIRVTPLGVSDESYFEDLSLAERQSVLAPYGLVNRPYILSVGTLEPRKNQSTLLQAYAELVKSWEVPEEVPLLVLVGKVGWNNEYDRLLKLAGSYGLLVGQDSQATSRGPQLLFLTKVDDLTLKALYQGAQVCAYPSLYEGFGLPALESLAAGAPLITSNLSSLPEVTGPDGQAALLVNPTDQVALTRALRTLWHDTELARRLKDAGRRRARLFSWRRTAELTLTAYQELYP